MRRIAILIGLMAAAVLAPQAQAQPLVESDRIDAVSVTVYRDPGRGEGAIDDDWPGGYALITETRTITIPAGRSVIRFVGVSQGMMPETAIVTGLPQGVNEKNRDARLLSPAALIDAYLKRRVTIRRTSRATGKVTEGEAVIQSGPGGGVLFSTADGVEALRCSGLPEGISYSGVPGDLSAKPTLSVVTDSAASVTVTVQLSYLAQGLDWQANYVAEVAEDGKSMSLFAWLTIVNGGSQGFANAGTNAVAGAPNKEDSAPLPNGPAPELHLQCWPMDITSTHPSWGMPVPPAPPPAPMMMAPAGDEIIVTGSRREAAMFDVASPVAVVVAEQEELGDLKLYRIPEPVTVAAQGRKQVAMIDRGNVRFERVYAAEFDAVDYDPDYAPGSEPATRMLRTENREAKGLGVPLPAGQVAVFERTASHGSLLLAEADLRDLAIGEEVELDTGESPEVRYELIARPPGKRRAPYRVRVTNARGTPETFEFAIPYRLAGKPAGIVERKGVKTWRVTVPANGEAVLDFAILLR
ncbi:DUF4139 domain-containing protein [Sphingomonas canadensis]|uniref:DUF4139 domain-containing protein n=1 Tax=Sphingomonas canadensis TaxID=1219257 RepID=A0ABW3H8G0_9SPHN|nr:hypothetical protein [Sphingomonas canadensis]MCW3837354.1 hypothetical protein [Sphingomonas canadensis]